MMFRPQWIPTLGAVLLQCAVAADAGAVVIPVTTIADSLALDGFCSLREAIDAANFDVAVDTCPAGIGTDEVSLPTGTYILSIAGSGENGNANGDLDITQSLIISGAGSSLAIIDGGAMERVLHVDPTGSGITVSISDVTVQNGSEQIGDGGGISNGGQLTLTRVAVINNSVDDFFGDGGGIINETSALLTVVDSTIEGNSALGGLGGGIANSGGASLTVTGSLISANVAEDGGGIETDDDITVRNSTLSGNRALGYGGGLEVSLGVARLSNVTIVSNRADDDNDDDGDGGGIDILDTVEIKNSILSGNSDTGTGPDCNGTITSLDYNLIRNTTGCDGFALNDILGLDANVGPLLNHGGFTETHVPRVCSIAVDAGNPAGCTDELGNPLLTDQRGIARPQNGRCDIGAVERTAGDADEPKALNFRLSGQKRVRPGGTLTYVARYRELDVPNNLTMTLPDGIVPIFVFPEGASISGNTLTWFDVKTPSGKARVRAVGDLGLVPGSTLTVTASVLAEICGDQGTATHFTSVIAPAP